MRGLGTVILAVAVGLVIFFGVTYYGGAARPEDVFIGCGAAGIVAMVGVGFFLASRYCDKPPKKEPERRDFL